MATKRTPDHKRIKRAEEGRDDWKVKALERREENQKLTTELNSTVKHLDTLINENTALKKALYEADKKLNKLEKEIEIVKKKPSN